MQPYFQAAPDVCTAVTTTTEAFLILDADDFKQGTKMWLLHVGNLVADEGIFLPLANTSTASNPNPEHKRRDMVMISALIEHPDEGLMLYEVGAGKDYPKVWGPQLSDVFARGEHREDMELDAAIAKTGHNIRDIEAVIIGHLHLDHAGGLHHFAGTGVPIYVHERELKHAFYSVATKTDLGVYLPSYLHFDFNWQPLHGEMTVFARGIAVYLCPGHTPGLCIMQVNLKNTGSWIFTSDQYIVQENYDGLGTQGWLTRDHPAWSKSNQEVHFLQKALDAHLILGHDRNALMRHKLAPAFHD